MSDRTTQYPAHLAKLVAMRLQSEHGIAPPEAVLTRMLETLYFASLKTDEGRPILCTVNYVDPDDTRRSVPGAAAGRLLEPRAVRPAAAVRRADAGQAGPGRRSGRLVAGRVSRQEKQAVHLGHGRPGAAAQRLHHARCHQPRPSAPGCFRPRSRASATSRSISNDSLIGSLEQNTLVEEYHDVLWAGPGARSAGRLFAQLSERHVGRDGRAAVHARDGELSC